MKVVILAGGYGTRLSEETESRPKPMIEVGGKPLLWHIMKLYWRYGYHEFIILAGYKGHVIKEYFANYYIHHSDITFDLQSRTFEVHSQSTEPWKVTILDTGMDTMTGGRLLRAKSLLQDSPFFLTYGDGLSDVDIPSLLKVHNESGGIITITTVQPDGRFGLVESRKGGKVSRFSEKPLGDGGRVSGGFFVCEPGIFDYLSDGDETILERTPFESLTSDGQMFSYFHSGFWKCIDTLRDVRQVNDLWKNQLAPWKVWD
ncbi:MAG: glucose-1-phosphate cytidylyltransferase [Deltaproteobacteria bacterium]|nr:glucose-1-phosphate cytidylyltransferase [Deltaproteobacteria bacterium]